LFKKTDDFANKKGEQKVPQIAQLITTNEAVKTVQYFKTRFASADS